MGASWEHRSLPGGDNFRFPIVPLPGDHFLVPKVVTAERGAVLLPAGLQAVNESLFNGGADVAVDPADPGEPVTEPLGLGSPVRTKLAQVGTGTARGRAVTTSAASPDWTAVSRQQ